MNRFLKLSAAVLWTCLVIWLSLTDAQNLPAPNRIHIDKLGHLAVYGLMALLDAWALKAFLPRRNVIGMSAGWTIFTGIVMEVLQWSLPGYRHFDILDIIANIMGAVFAAIFMKILRDRYGSISKNHYK